MWQEISFSFYEVIYSGYPKWIIKFGSMIDVISDVYSVHQGVRQELFIFRNWKNASFGDRYVLHNCRTAPLWKGNNYTSV